jgi:Transcriptional regulators
MIEWEPDPERPKWIQVTEIIRRRIEDGTYAPRTPVPSIERIRQEFGVSRNTARKILRHLAFEGWVRPRPSMGTFVVPEHERRPPEEEEG